MQPVPNVDTFCTYGDFVPTQAVVSATPQPGSNDTYAPAVGLRVPKIFCAPSVPLSPLNVQFLNPVPSRIKNMF